MSAEDDPYSVLGVPSGASERQVEVAFHDISFRLRADRNPGDAEAAAELARATAAYEQLKAAKWFLPVEPGNVPFGAEPPTWSESTPQEGLWADGTPVHYPAPEDVERVRRGDKGPNASRTIRWFMLVLMMLIGLAGWLRGRNEHSDWPGIRMERNRSRGYTVVPDTYPP